MTPRNYRVHLSNDTFINISAYDAIDAITQAVIQYSYKNPNFQIPQIKKVEPFGDIKESINTLDDLKGKIISVDIKEKVQKTSRRKTNNFSSLPLKGC
jgi:hypothetical protein